MKPRARLSLSSAQKANHSSMTQRGIDITLDGLPVPWAAHQGYGKRSFNPRFKEKAHAQWQIRNQFQGFPFEGPVSISVSFHLPIPKSTSKKKRALIQQGLEFPLKKPDIDNLCKFLCDCLKTITFLDDSQIVELIAQKYFSDHPRTVISIKPL